MQSWIVRNLRKNNFQIYTGVRFSVWWQGHLYMPGHAAGVESVNRLAWQLAHAPLAAICHRLKGVFGLFVWDRRERTWQIAVDNAGLYRVYFDTSGNAASRFLELAALRGADATGLDTDSLVEFLLHGCVHTPRTLIADVHRLPARAVLRLGSGTEPGPPKIEPKLLPEPEDDRSFAAVLDAHADDLACSLAGSPLSVDLTGGFDSRLLACLLRSRGIGDEAAMNSEPHSIDAARAKEVAGLLGLPMQVQRQTIDHLEADMAALLIDSDALVDVARLHRDWQTARARRARGMKVLAHGGGGELLKDFYYHHEFPFYGTRAASLERLYDLRLVPMPFVETQLTPMARRWVQACRTRLVGQLEGFRAATNHETCDRAFYGFRLPESFGGHFSTYINMGLNVVAPFMDKDVATAAMALPPWSRIMEAQHRRLLDALNPRAAALPTTNGYSASLRAAQLARDLPIFAANETRRAINKLAQRHLGRAPFPRPGALDNDASGFVDRMRGLPALRAGLAMLQKRGIYTGAVEPMALRPHEVGRVLTLGLCGEHLAQARHSADALARAS